ncbi:dnaJ homolog subfamily C member 11 [Sarcophilus harrisii]|uniref:dnaJ homolog subfamily C member 11 n=1 Tax=Sarcophilus harrisii TaxID=9305 RepID=UPI001301F8D2|nr:dnaJ homolog subfamily C member 11 [Sarcophilus harrisii]
MATALSEEELDNEDYYSLLNVRREASSEELKAAYRRLCMLYHPDKHRDPELKSQAEQLFNLVHQAYEVLSDPQTRAIYDIYGRKGLEMEGWEIVERRRTPAEIREEFERLQREREERRLQQRTNPKGTISVGVDATDLFDRYDEEYEDVPGSGFPQIEINKMHISQSIEAPLTATDTAILSGSLSTQNGNGGGSINFALRRVTSAKGWGEFEFGAGDLQGPLFGLKLFRNLTPRCFIKTQFSSPGGLTHCLRNLDKNTMGYLQWRWGIQSAMNTSIVRDTKTSHFTVAFQVSLFGTGSRLRPPSPFPSHPLISLSRWASWGGCEIAVQLPSGRRGHAALMEQLIWKGEKRRREIFQMWGQGRQRPGAQVCPAEKGPTGRAGFFGTVVEYGAERKISRHSILGATVSVGVPQGVSLKIKLNRASQTYFFPIHLTDQLLPSAVFYATLGPLVAYFAMHRLIIKPYLRAQKEKELEKQRESTATDVLQKKQEAESAVRLMQESVRRIIESEESRMGLIILNAGGKFVRPKRKKGRRFFQASSGLGLGTLGTGSNKATLCRDILRGSLLPAFEHPCSLAHTVSS